MDKQSRTYQAYVQILKEELIPAMGCTEPIAIAYAAAKARDVLGGMPDKVEIGVSSNIIKNVKSVIVPNTDGMKGIEAAAAAGIVGGQADKALEVIAAVTTDQKAAMRAFLKQVPVTVKAIDNGFIFDIIVTLRQGDDSAVVRICQYHTNIVLIQRNSEVLLDHTAQETKQLCGDAAPAESGLTDRALLNIADIFAFADTCEINDIRPLLEIQIRYNTRISEEGLRGDYGANIGSTMLKFYGEDVRNRAIAYLQGADLKAVSHTLVNALAIVSGIICDGAKASCAAKIASSVEAGILGYHMYKNGQQFRSGDGIVTKGVENTIRNVGLLGREGMRETDKEIVRIMLQEP